MSDEAERLATLVRGLPEAKLRATFMRDYVGDGHDEEALRALDAVCAAGARAESAAKEAVLALAMMLSAHADDPLLDRVGAFVATLGLEHLGRLLRRAPNVTMDEPERRVPDYGAGRELSVGERKALARRPSRAAFDKLLRDPHPLVIRQLLENPRLTEDDIVRVAARRPANVEALRAIAQTAWLCRPRVRMALIQNPGTPSGIAIPLLAVCTRPELIEVRTSQDCGLTVRETAAELLMSR